MHTLLASHLEISSVGDVIRVKLNLRCLPVRQQPFVDLCPNSKACILDRMCYTLHFLLNFLCDLCCALQMGSFWLDIAELIMVLVLHLLDFSLCQLMECIVCIHGAHHLRLHRVPNIADRQGRQLVPDRGAGIEWCERCWLSRFRNLEQVHCIV